jgi:hypothetical protein
MFQFLRRNRLTKEDAIDLVWGLLEREKPEVVHRAQVRAVAGDRTQWWIETDYCDPPNTIPPLSRLFTVNHKTRQIEERPIEDIIQFEWWQKAPLDYAKEQKAKREAGISDPPPVVRTNPKPRTFPTDETVDTLSERDLYEACWIEATDRFNQCGFDALNEAERVIYCLIQLESEVNNGGFSLWLYGTDPQVIRHTPISLVAIESKKIGAVINQVLEHTPGLADSETHDLWYAYFDSLPESIHLKIERLDCRYAKFESDMLAAVYRFARRHWREIRPMSQPGRVV